MSLPHPKTKWRRNHFRVKITSCVSAGGYYKCFTSELKYPLERLVLICKGMYKKIVYL